MIGQMDAFAAKIDPGHLIRDWYFACFVSFLYNGHRVGVFINQVIANNLLGSSPFQPYSFKVNAFLASCGFVYYYYYLFIYLYVRDFSPLARSPLDFDQWKLQWLLYSCVQKNSRYGVTVTVTHPSYGSTKGHFAEQHMIKNHGNDIKRGLP